MSWNWWLVSILMSSSWGFTSSSVCRGPDGQYLPVDLFALDTCARCYHYLPDQPSFFKTSKWDQAVLAVSTEPHGTVYNVTHLRRKSDNFTVFAEPSDESSPLRSSFHGAKAISKWTSCCAAAIDCCQNVLLSSSVDGGNTTTAIDNQHIRRHMEKTARSETRAFTASPLSDREEESAVAHEEFCPSTWDGWTCWRQTPSNQLAFAACPDHIYFETEPPACTRYAVKVCTGSGTWYKRKEMEKTNYAPCASLSMLKQRTNIHVIAYAVSCTLLLPALLIFYSYKQLDVYRIRLHKNLFISILFNSIFVIVFKTVAILPQFESSASVDSYIKQNTLVCRLLLMVTKYLRMTNYTWMFCEGFYLHRLIANAFSELKSFLIFYVLGWVFPLLPIGIYTVVRALYYDEKCWVEPIEAYEWILNLPCLVSLVANMVFLINIIRILVMKLRTAHSNEPSQYRKAVRATLVLVPLFGLHFVLTIYRPQNMGCEWTELYHYFNALLDGLQGCLVAIIFCYANGEIHYLLKRSYKRFKEERCQINMNSITGRCRMPQGNDSSGVDQGCSLFYGRTVVSTTHMSVADNSPQQRRINSIPMVPLTSQTQRGKLLAPTSDPQFIIVSDYSSNGDTVAIGNNRVHHQTTVEVPLMGSSDTCIDDV